MVSAFVDVFIFCVKRSHSCTFDPETLDFFKPNYFKTELSTFFLNAEVLQNWNDTLHLRCLVFLLKLWYFPS